MPAALATTPPLQTVLHTLDFGSCGGREDFHVYPRYTDLQPLGNGGFAFVVGCPLSLSCLVLRPASTSQWAVLIGCVRVDWMSGGAGGGVRLPLCLLAGLL